MTVASYDTDHKCTDCGNVTVYHRFAHESRGDTVKAWCPVCEEDTTHEIQ